jgi:hypothetical protein
VGGCYEYLHRLVLPLLRHPGRSCDVRHKGDTMTRDKEQKSDLVLLLFVVISIILIWR